MTTFSSALLLLVVWPPLANQHRQPLSLSLSQLFLFLSLFHSPMRNSSLSLSLFRSESEWGPHVNGRPAHRSKQRRNTQPEERGKEKRNTIEKRRGKEKKKLERRCTEYEIVDDRSAGMRPDRSTFTGRTSAKSSTKKRTKKKHQQRHTHTHTGRSDAKRRKQKSRDGN